MIFMLIMISFIMTIFIFASPLTTVNFASLGCTVNGLRGNGTSRGSCPEKQLCKSNGVCQKGCLVLGQPGTGAHRGDCQEGLKCFPTGECREGVSEDTVGTTPVITTIPPTTTSRPNSGKMILFLKLSLTLINKNVLQ